MSRIPRGPPLPAGARPTCAPPYPPIHGLHRPTPASLAIPVRGWMPPRPLPPRGLWPLPHRPPPPPRLSMRSPPPRPALPALRPPPPPVRRSDPDVEWLQSFLQQYLPKRGADKTDSGGESRLRSIKKRLGEIETLADELEAAAYDLADVEERLQSASSCDETERSRMRVQAERKRTHCEHLRSRLELLQVPQPLGLGEAKYRDVLSYRKTIEKKKRYRQRRADRVKAEVVIRRGLEAHQSLEPTEQTDLKSELATAQSQASTSGAGPESLQHQTMPTAQTSAKETEPPTLKDTLRGSKRGRRRRRRSQVASPRFLATKPRFLPLREPYPADMETLVLIRRQWDAYLAPRGVLGASMIPPHLVSPPVDPGPRWAPFLTTGRTLGDEDGSI